MKRIYVLSVWVCLLLGMSSCTKDNFAYSGISKVVLTGICWNIWMPILMIGI